MVLYKIDQLFPWQCKVQTWVFWVMMLWIYFIELMLFQKCFFSLPIPDNNKVKTLQTGNVGRPSYDIPQDLLVNFFETGMSQKEIAAIIGVTQLEELKNMVYKILNILKFQTLKLPWHIDGHHKLIRWGFVVHGGVDGFQRKIMYIRCNGNNRAETVFNLFYQARQINGLPSRVRADQGKENVEVVKYMFKPLRGPGRKLSLIHI